MSVKPGRVFQSLPVVDVADPNVPLPLGPAGVLHGSLKNGIKYYVRPCAKPKERAALALVVRIGSAVEEANEQGVAHIVEHLAFNATESMHNHEIVRFLESIGAQFGACQNAYTSADETAYQMVVPVGPRPGASAAPGSRAGDDESAADSDEQEDEHTEEEREGGQEGGAGPSTAEQQDKAPTVGESVQTASSTKDLTSTTQEGLISQQQDAKESSSHPPADGQPQDLKLLNDALGVLAQFAFKIRCAAGDLSKERGAVLEEWRMARTASGRASEAHWKLLMQGSRYADRLPIGTEAIIRSVSADTVRAFYERWYRPEHMAVIAVGDFAKPDDVVSMVRAAFEGGQSRDPAPPRPIPSFPYAPHTEPRYKVFIDRETQESLVYVSFKHAPMRITTAAEYLAYLEHWVFTEVFNTRLFKLSREQDPPFATAAASDEPMTRTTGLHCMSAAAMEGQALRALEALLTEVARLRCHGISDRQFEQALADIRSDIENTWLERDQSYCWDIRDEYCRNFLEGEMVTGQGYEARLAKTLLGQVDKRRVEAWALEYLPSASCVIKVTEHRRHCSEADLAAVVARVTQAEAEGRIGPWEGDSDLPDRLMPHDVAPMDASSAIVMEKEHQVLGATEIKLSNGMTVVLKPTGFMEDEVMLTGIALGGLSEVPEDQYINAWASRSIAGHLGPFGHKPHVLNDLLAGQRVEVSTSEKSYSRTLTGIQSPDHMETVLQLVHLLFTNKVQVDEKELEVVMRLIRQGVDATLRNPMTAYHDRVRLLNYGDSYFFRNITHQDIDKLDVHQSVGHHNRSYSNPAEYILVFTGNVSREGLLPLILQYLATIPPADSPKPKARRDITPLPFTPISGAVVEDVKVPMVSPMTKAQLTFPVVLKYSPSGSTAREDYMWICLICDLLETRLMQQMRFKWGDVYTVSVSPSFAVEAPSRIGDSRGDVSVVFTCDPANRSKLIEIALEQMEALQESGPTAQEVATVVNLERLAYEENQAENSYWHDLLVSGVQSKAYQERGALDESFTRRMEARAKVLGEASPEAIRDAARRCFPLPCRSSYTAISMVPRPPSLLTRALRTLTSLATAPLALLGGKQPKGPLYVEEPLTALDPAASLSLGAAGSGAASSGAAGGMEGLVSAGSGALLLRTSGSLSGGAAAAAASALSPGRASRSGGWALNGSGTGGSRGQVGLAVGAVTVAAVAAAAALVILRSSSKAGSK